MKARANLINDMFVHCSFALLIGLVSFIPLTCKLVFPPLESNVWFFNWVDGAILYFSIALGLTLYRLLVKLHVLMRREIPPTAQ